MQKDRRTFKSISDKKEEWQYFIKEINRLFSDWQNQTSKQDEKEKVNRFMEEVKKILTYYQGYKNGQIFSKLTKRELEVVGLICVGKTIEEIAKSLHISAHTVETHRGNIFSKLDVRNVQELILLSINSGEVFTNFNFKSN